MLYCHVKMPFFGSVDILRYVPDLTPFIKILIRILMMQQKRIPLLTFDSP